MCIFGGGQKKQELPPPTPPPAPQPTPVPTDTSPTQTEDQRKRRVDALKFGVLSTIKTGPQGTTGSGPNLVSAQAGGMYGGPFKKNLGS